MYRVLLLIIFISVVNTAQTSNFIKGMDVSFIPQLEDNGAVWYNHDWQTSDPLDIFNQNEINYIRLRLWHTPEDGYSGLEKTLQMAARIKNAGFKFLLNFHYSDTWADPGNQEKPAAWDSLTYQELVDSIYVYTFNVIQAFNANNLLPDMVQIGNEIYHGFLWPEGDIRSNTSLKWQQFTSLLKEASNAVSDAVIGADIPVMVHIEIGGDNVNCRRFYDKLDQYEVPYDVIGLSFYPWWLSPNGTIQALKNNVYDLADRYEKDIVIVETAYPWTLDSYDNTPNFVTNSSQLLPGYPASLTGQYYFFYDLINIIKDIPGERGKGLFYWEPEWISLPTFGSLYENLTLFNFDGKVLNSIRVFKEPYPPGIDSVYIQILSQTSVSLNVIVNSGNQSTAIRFQWDTDSTTVWTNDQFAANSPLLIGTASYTLNNLDPDVTYYFRAYVSNDSGSDTSIIKSFNTTPLINVKIFLEGPYKGNDTMSTNLKRIIPQISPYPEASDTISYRIPDNITDWVLLQLRGATNSGSTFFSKSCFLRDDGIIIDPDDLTENISLTGISSGNYYIVLKHRNHLAVMSKGAVQLNGLIFYDFTSSASKYYGTGGTKELEPNIWGMIAGDANGDGEINALDRNETWNFRNQLGYILQDVTTDGEVNALDRNTTWNNRNFTTLVP